MSKGSWIVQRGAQRAGLLGLALSTLVAALMPRSAAASPRTWQPLIVTGAEMRPLLGASIAHLEVLAVKSGALEPIPFQVDERLPDGAYVLPNGPYPVAARDPGILDIYDQTVMMISDLGPRAAADTSGMPPGALEIEFDDPLGGPARYAYVAAVAIPRRSTTRYVIFAPLRDRIETPHYRVGFARALPNEFALQDRMFENTPNLLDGFQILVHARIFKLFPFRLTQRDVRNRLVAWKEGPVRVIRQLSHSVNLLFGIRSPTVTSEDFFYRDYMDNPFTVKFPWVPSVVFGDIYVRTDVQFLGITNFKLSWSGMSGPPVTIGDRAEEQRLEDRDPPPEMQWMALSGGGRVIVQTLAPNPDLKVVRPRLFFRAGPGPDAPPEKDAGEGDPRIGYVMTGWQKLSGGTHHVDSLMISAPRDYGPKTILAELANPPSVRVTSVAAEKPSTRASPGL